MQKIRIYVSDPLATLRTHLDIEVEDNLSDEEIDQKAVESVNTGYYRIIKWVKI